MFFLRKGKEPIITFLSRGKLAIGLKQSIANVYALDLLLVVIIELDVQVVKTDRHIFKNRNVQIKRKLAWEVRDWWRQWSVQLVHAKEVPLEVNIDGTLEEELEDLGLKDKVGVGVHGPNFQTSGGPEPGSNCGRGHHSLTI